MIDTTIPSLSGLGSNAYEVVIHISQSSRPGSSSSNGLVIYPLHSFGGGSYLSAKNVVDIFSSPSPLGYFVYVSSLFFLFLYIWNYCNFLVPVHFLYLIFRSPFSFCPGGYGCRIHRLHLCIGVRPPNEYPRYETKQSDREVPVMLGLWGMRSIPSLSLLPGSTW